jgi:signal transduction histidine kinase
MKIFDRAVLKLTAVYTAILLLVSLIFSATIYGITASEMGHERPLRTTRTTLVLPDGTWLGASGLEEVIRERNREVLGSLLVQLVAVNLAVVALGAVISYFLARWTVRPIREAYEAQSRFVADASHELRTPLTAIAMENEVLLRDKRATREEYRETVASNLDEVGKLQRLTNYLLQLNKKADLALEEVAVTEVVREAVAELAPLAEAKRITIKTMAGKQVVRAEKEALVRLVGILLENAIKYSPEETTVRVAAKAQGIAVSDEGCGIAEEDLPRIFERFYRAEKSRTSEGYGLGLALARELAGQMGMRIEVENNRDKGATFWVKWG